MNEYNEYFLKRADVENIPEKLPVYRLIFIGFDSWDRPCYEDQHKKLWKDVDPSKDSIPKLCNSVNNDLEGEPDTEMRYGDVFFYPDRVTWELTRKNDISSFFELSNQNLTHIPGKIMLGYTRMYFRGKRWHDNAFHHFSLTEEEEKGIEETEKAVTIFWPRGVNWKMEEDMRSAGFFRSEDKKRFILRVKDNPDIYLLVDLRLGNADYPIHIFVYRNINSDEPEEDEHYTPSSTARDYGPGNPWDAPGMSIKDFI